MRETAFVLAAPILSKLSPQQGKLASASEGLRNGRSCARRPQARHILAPVSCLKPVHAAPSASEDSASLLSSYLSPAMLAAAVEGTQLANCELAKMYDSARDGWSNKSFFEANVLFEGGVPTLLVGRTVGGAVFGGVNSVGFDRRDDYRDSVTCLLFAIDKNGKLQISRPATRQGSTAIMDFEDCAVSFGTADLRIPMNQRKYLLAPDRATSALGANYNVLPNGQTSLFGENSVETLERLETYVKLQFVEEAAALADRVDPSLGDLVSSFAQKIFGTRKQAE
jgi:TLD